MTNSEKRERLIKRILTVLIPVGLFVYCFFLHPQVILDYDDWSYVSYSRIPVPWPSFWNPSRVLPELIMPLFGRIGALLYRLFPSLGYIRAETLAFAVMLSLMLFGYVGFFFRYLRKRIGLSESRALLAAFLFFLLHFLIFRTEETENNCLFRTANLTCCCFYLVPVLWNAASVLLLASEPALYDAFSKHGRIRNRLAVLLLVYFGVFSNLYAGILLAVFAGLRLLEAILKREKRTAIIKTHGVSLLILTFWGVSLLFEAMGGRAGLADSGTPFSEKLAAVLQGGTEVLRSFNPVFTALLVLLPATALLLRRKRKTRIIPKLFLAVILIAVYIVLLCAKVDPAYIQRPEVLISIFSPLLAAAAILFGFLLENSKKGILWGTVLLLLLYGCTDTPGRTFAESYGIDAVITPETCIAVSQDVVDQVIQAEREGRTQLTIDVSFNGDYCDNWPQCTYLQQALLPTLRRHGVIHSDMEADIFPSMEFNAKYKLDFPLLRDSEA